MFTVLLVLYLIFSIALGVIVGMAILFFPKIGAYGVFTLCALTSIALTLGAFSLVKFFL